MRPTDIDRRIKKIEDALRPQRRLVCMLDSPENRRLVESDPAYRHTIVVFLTEPELAL